MTYEAEGAKKTAEEQTSGQAAEGDPANNVVLKIRRRKFGRAPVRAGEITVTRRLFRTGDSEYLLNGKICRLRDIQDIFMGTGLGGESYAIIGQERIGQILSSKPLDRRGIIEEAAGITRFKTKKRLAELRLESAKQNLSRVNDIFEEVTRQMATLKRQASKPSATAHCAMSCAASCGWCWQADCHRWMRSRARRKPRLRDWQAWLTRKLLTWKAWTLSTLQA